MASVKKKSNSRDRSAPVSRTADQHFVVCVRNRGYRASLELRKLYRVVADTFADEHQMIRVIDESGEDYLYPAKFFVRVELPRTVERALGMIA